MRGETSDNFKASLHAAVTILFACRRPRCFLAFSIFLHERTRNAQMNSRQGFFARHMYTFSLCNCQRVGTQACSTRKGEKEREQPQIPCFWPLPRCFRFDQDFLLVRKTQWAQRAHRKMGNSTKDNSAAVLKYDCASNPIGRESGPRFFLHLGLSICACVTGGERASEEA